MQHESNLENELNIEDTEKNFDYWLNQNFISDDLKSKLKTADILLVPQIGFRDQDTPVFPVKQKNCLHFLKTTQKITK